MMMLAILTNFFIAEMFLLFTDEFKAQEGSFEYLRFVAIGVYVVLNLLYACLVYAYYTGKRRTVPALATQTNLAKNGQRVLKILLAGAKRPLRDTSNAVKVSKALAKLPFSLPWLPAHDRRDALIIQEVVRRLVQQDGARDLSAAFDAEALAFCVFVSCKCSQPAASNGSVFASNFTAPTGDYVGTKSPREWLAENNLSVQVRSSSGWYDETAPVAPAEEGETILSRAALKPWKVYLYPGWTFMLIAPTGFLKLGAPVFNRWALHSTTAMPPRRQFVLVVMRFVVLSVAAVCAALVSTQGPFDRYEGHAAAIQTILPFNHSHAADTHHRPCTGLQRKRPLTLSSSC